MRKAIQRFFRLYHDRIIKGQAYVNFIVFLVAACCLDGEGYTAQIVCSVTLLWLMVYAYVNGFFQYEEDNEE